MRPLLWTRNRRRLLINSNHRAKVEISTRPLSQKIPIAGRGAIVILCGPTSPRADTPNQLKPAPSWEDIVQTNHVRKFRCIRWSLTDMPEIDPRSSVTSSLLRRTSSQWNRNLREWMKKGVALSVTRSIAYFKLASFERCSTLTSSLIPSSWRKEW